MAILVRPEKVAKSTQNSLKGCTFKNIAGVGHAEKKIARGFLPSRHSHCTPGCQNLYLKNDPHRPNSI